MDLPKSISESQIIYKRLYCSQAIDTKYIKLKCDNTREWLHNAMAVQVTGEFSILTGSAGEGTDITPEDYGKHAHSSCYFSDKDFMTVLYSVRVIEEGDTSPHIFANHMYCRAERGEHTTDGFRKLRIIHSPEYLVKPHWAKSKIMSGGHEYVSSSKLLSTAVSSVYTLEEREQNGLGTQGPSQTFKADGFAEDLVRCFYVKTWPKEAESWFTRQTHWPDCKLKDKIRKIGYLLVPTGNPKSQEVDLEWRCSFSIAEKILYQSLTKFPRCTFLMLKVLLKEYLPSNINTDGEKQLLSSYHIKTLFLWCLEDSKIKWEAGNILGTIGLIIMFDKLLKFINQQSFPHYFIPSINLLDGGRLHGREKSLICSISAIRNDLINKIKHSKFFMGQEINRSLAAKGDCRVLASPIRFINRNVMQCITGILQTAMHHRAIVNIISAKKILSHSMLIEGLINIKPVVDPHVLHLYRAMYTDYIHDELLTETVPVLMDQYCGCIHLAKYCMAARDGRVLTAVLHTAKSLLKDTLHLDPCSGYVKLASLYIATGNFTKAMDRLHEAENHFMFIHKNMVTSSVIRNLQHYRINIDRLSYNLYTAITHNTFLNWAEGQVTSYIVVTWPEYITAPDLVQFELIHKSTQHVFNIPNHYRYGDAPGNIVSTKCLLQFPPLSLIQLLKFVCAFYLRQYSTSHIENLVEDLMASSLYDTLTVVNDIYTVFNMAAWCYVKINKYKRAIRMMTRTIGSSSENDIMKRCAFSYHFSTYVIGQCLAIGNRVLVYNRETMSGYRKQSPGLQ